MNSNILLKVERLTKQEYDKIENWAHGWEHIVHVVEFSKKLAEMENYNSNLCAVAAYCHDLGRVEEEKNKEIPHAALSVKPTKEILKKVGIKGEKADLIIEAVAVHSQKYYNGENKVAKILRDADKKDGSGFYGMLRVIRFDCCFKFDMPEKKDYEKVLRKLILIVIKDEKMKREFLNHIKMKREWYEERLDTESGKIFLKPEYDEVLEIEKMINN